MSCRLILLCLVMTALCTGSQAQLQKPDFTQIDQRARSIRFDDDITKLVQNLTSPYTDKLSKARSIFIWITEHIRYDWKFFNKDEEIKIPECKSGQDCDEVLANWEKKYLNTILRKGKLS